MNRHVIGFIGFMLLIFGPIFAFAVWHHHVMQGVPTPYERCMTDRKDHYLCSIYARMR